MLQDRKAPSYQEQQEVVTVDMTEEAKKQVASDHAGVIRSALGILNVELVRLYIFCDKIQDVTSKRLLLASMMKMTSIKNSKDHVHRPSMQIVTRIYNGTVSRQDLMRRWLVDLTVRCGHPGYCE